VLPATEIASRQTLESLMRRDPVTGKTFVNIMELYNLRNQLNQTVKINEVIADYKSIN
jgi:hypothetical protein